jgi:hypothetical protein
VSGTATVAGASPEVRAALRDILSTSEAFNALPPETRTDIAHALVRISQTALALAETAEPRVSPPVAPRPLAMAQNAGQEFSGAATDRLASTTRNVLNAISFPRFVNELITGVFKAINESNEQQLQSFVELIRNVAATTGDFAEGNISIAAARQWLADRFPGNFEVRGPEEEAPEDVAAMDAEERRAYERERDRNTRLQLKPGAEFPSEGMLRTGLSLRPEEALPGRNPEELVGFARQAMARNRQQMLSTMVMMGLQRIVVESGRLSASMNFHIDARSAATADRGSRFDFNNETSASGSVGFGPWAASASVKNTIGYVTTNNASTTEELNTSANLGSSVELIFRSDYVPLARLAGVQEVERIKVNSINPQAEMAAAAREEGQRQAAQRTSEAGRRADVKAALAPRPPAPQPPAQPAPNQPPTQGSQSPTQASQPPTQGSQPPTQGSQPPTQGSQPPTQGSQPPTQGRQPPTQGSQPAPAQRQAPPPPRPTSGQPPR